MGVQLTPGQKCILDILQKRLLATIHAYRELSLVRLDLEEKFLASIGSNSTTSSSTTSRDEAANGYRIGDPVTNDMMCKQIYEKDYELWTLQAKIKRISARQKRFTNEILNANGNNTIPKENYFRALGLITKDALDRINLKSSERRRRTTANPRFSHEAILAKRALEHHSQSTSLQAARTSNRLEDKATRNTPTRSSLVDKDSNSSRRGRDKIENNPISNNKVSKTGVNYVGSPQNQLSKANKSGNGRSNGRNSNNNDTNKSKALNDIDKNHNVTCLNDNKRRNLLNGTATSYLSEHEKQQLHDQFTLLQEQIFTKISQINEKRGSNRRLQEENEAIRKRSLEMMTALNEFCQSSDVYIEPRFTRP